MLVCIYRCAFRHILGFLPSFSVLRWGTCFMINMFSQMACMCHFVFFMSFPEPPMGISELPIVNSVPSSCNMPKLEWRKEIKEKLSEPNNPTGNGDDNKTIPKALVHNQVFRKTSHSGDQIESANQIRSTMMWHPLSVIKNFGTVHLLIILIFKQYEL